MAGDVVGMDLAEALAPLPAGLDRDLATALLVAAETGTIAALIDKAEAEKPADKPPPT